MIDTDEKLAAFLPTVRAASWIAVDTEADSLALREWLAGLQVHVNLIPYNPPPDADSVPLFRGHPLPQLGTRFFGAFRQKRCSQSRLNGQDLGYFKRKPLLYAEIR